MAQPAISQGILVLGAGELGTAMLNALVDDPKRDTTINVFLRPSTISTEDPSRRSELDLLKSKGISLVAGDLVKNSIPELSSIFSRFDTVIGCTGMVGPPELQQRILEAILAAKVRKYIPWQFGVDYDTIERVSGYDAAGGLFSQQMDIRRRLRGQETTKWVIVSTGMFMSFIFEPSFGIVSEDRRNVRALGSWDNKVTLTDVSDIGRVTAAIVFDKPEIVDQVVFCAGDTVEYRKVVTVLKNKGIDITGEEWTIEILKEDLNTDPENQLKKYRVVFAEGTGLSWDDAKTYNFEKNIDMMKLEQWVDKNIGI